ncbi:unnamed protein product [Allacma fusca]|uniref:Uncharacterized protein n=1 Tax=Allacma fusca TaxID=39272 RepID=A0A8J2P3R4_9HEXA|nr:unnamed protein product [Allacma fusca]
MTKTSYALIFWEKETAYSVIHRRKILSGLEGDCIVRKTVMVRWDKEDLPTMFSAFGKKSDMKALEDNKVKDANNASLIYGAEDKTALENATDVANITEEENVSDLSVLCNDRSAEFAQNYTGQNDEKIRRLEMQLAAL